VGQVPHDGVGAGVQAGRGELLAQLDDEVQHLRGGRVGVGPRPPRAGLKDGLPLAAVAGEQPYSQDLETP
jgi:hypothetical protein